MHHKQHVEEECDEVEGSHHAMNSLWMVVHVMQAADGVVMNKKYKGVVPLVMPHWWADSGTRWQTPLGSVPNQTQELVNLSLPHVGS